MSTTSLKTDMEYLTKSIPFKVKDVDVKSRIVSLYFAAFNIVDLDGDSIVKGAFKKTFDEHGPTGKNKIWHLDQHMTIRRLGKPKELFEDDYGALAVSQIRDTTLGRDIMQFYEAGDITEHSFGYTIENGEPTENAYLLKELKVFEYSTVTWGSNENTPTVDVKAQKQNIEDEMAKWSKWLSKGNVSDETCELLEIQLRQWSEALKKMKQPSQSGDTLRDGKPSQSGDTYEKLIESVQLRKMMLNLKN